MSIILDGTSGITYPNSVLQAGGVSAPATVAQGGTGNATATAYAVQCGGTTTTGVHQSVASVGTTGQVLTSNGASALPTFQTISSGGMTLLGTLTTTSGTTQTLSGLTLTNYKYLYLTIQNVSFNASAALYKEGSAIQITRDTGAAANALWGIMLVDLSTGTFGTTASTTTQSSGESGINGVTTAGRVDWSTATTSLVFSGGSGAVSFDAGTIKIYGVA
jgi:hypothetical protein